MTASTLTTLSSHRVALPSDKDFATLITGDSLDYIMGAMRMNPRSVHAVVTSPPYWKQRLYTGDPREIGREKTPEEYISKLTTIFVGMHRVLRDDGTFWLNIGDAYGKDGQLLGIPWRLAESLKKHGWICRSEIIWFKPNANPETADDRLGRTHEVIFMFSKNEQYYYDRLGYTEPAKYGAKKGDIRLGRTVWTIPLQPTKIKHFAAFPVALAERCIRIGASTYGVCPDCGTPFERVIHRERVPTRTGKNTKTAGESSNTIGNRDPLRHVTRFESMGFTQMCSCEWGKDPKPATILDPFGGIHRTGVAAMRAGCRYIGVDIDPRSPARFIQEINNEEDRERKKRKKKDGPFLPGWSQAELFAE